jgi:hypothetical protein
MSRPVAPPIPPTTPEEAYTTLRHVVVPIEDYLSWMRIVAPLSSQLAGYLWVAMDQQLNRAIGEIAAQALSTAEAAVPDRD